MRNVGIYVYDEVEVLDFAGPFEVFFTASRVFRRQHPDGEPPFNVFTVGETGTSIKARGSLAVEPHFAFDQHPKIEVLIIAGGVVTKELEKPGVIAWIAAHSKLAELTASVCTGAFLLGKAGLLTGKRVITHWEDVTDLRAMLPNTQVIEAGRWQDEGALVTSAGISAGLDMSLHLVARLAGHELAVRTARQMDYDWREQP
jgi:transcriptional regulator GlxA family with amidase domain